MSPRRQYGRDERNQANRVSPVDPAVEFPRPPHFRSHPRHSLDGRNAVKKNAAATTIPNAGMSQRRPTLPWTAIKIVPAAISAVRRPVAFASRTSELVPVRL
jgi:hypothetical protein